MVTVCFAEGFEETEALCPVDILRRAGVEVVLAGVGGREITGSHGITVRMDAALEEVERSALDALVLPGGMPGTRNLEASPALQELLRRRREARGGDLRRAVDPGP